MPLGSQCISQPSNRIDLLDRACHVQPAGIQSGSAIQIWMDSDGAGENLAKILSAPTQVVGTPPPP